MQKSKICEPLREAAQNPSMNRFINEFNAEADQAEMAYYEHRRGRERLNNKVRKEEDNGEEAEDVFHHLDEEVDSDGVDEDFAGKNSDSLDV